MNPKPAPVLHGYLAALRRHLRGSPAPASGAARTLGIRALRKRLGILELARIHEDAMVALGFPLSAGSKNDEITRRAGSFFAEALAPIEETHRGMQEANALLKAAVATLKQRSSDLDASNRDLNREILQRKRTEDSLRTSESTSNRMLVKSRRIQEELRLLSHRLLSIQEDERKRISHELHDVIAQTLVGINLQLATLRLQSSTDAKEFRRKIAVTQQLVEMSMGTVHRFALELRPTALDDLGLIPALRSHLKSFTAGTGITVAFTANPPLMDLACTLRTVLYRTAREALTYLSRHPEARHANLVIEKIGDRVTMEITGNGIGPDFPDPEPPRGDGRLGLLEMRERVDMVGGIFHIDSIPGKPATLHVELPLGKRRLKTAAAGKKAGLAPRSS